MKGSRNQYICSFILSIGSFMACFGVVWPSYALPLLESAHTPLNYSITKRDGDLIGSLPMLGSLIVTIIISYMSDRLGRKKPEILCGLFMILSWAIIATAKTPIQILIGRLIYGFGIGIHFTVSLIFVGEIAHPSIRGTTTSILMSFFSTGALGSYLAGWFCSFELICYLNVFLGVLFVVLISFMKETPAYLISKGKDKDAIKSLTFYRAATTSTEEILDEFNYIKSQRVNDVYQKLEKSPNEIESEKLNNFTEEKKDISSWKLLVTSKSSQRVVVSLSLMITFMVFMGMNGLQAYAGQFFTMAAPNISPHLCSVVLAIVLAVSSGMAASITDLFDRRVLMIFSTSSTSLLMAVLGMQLRWKFGPDWMIPVIVVLCCVSYQIGANNIPFVYASECVTPEMRGLTMQIVTCFNGISNFFLLFIFGPTVEYIGLDGTFFGFSLIGATFTVLLILFMKETRGVPLEIVQEMFAHGYLYRKINK